MEATRIILNPDDGRGRVGRLWQLCQRLVLSELAPAETVLVGDPDDAAQAAKESALAGYLRMVAVGGGATINGVINGLMGLTEDHRKRVKLGVLSLHKPGDWSRTVDFPKRLTRQLEVLRAAQTIPFDLGRVDFIAAAAEPAARFFLSGAGFGVVSPLALKMADAPAPGLGPLAANSRSALRALMGRLPRVRIESAERVVYEGPWFTGAAMIGRYYPLLGDIAPEADPLSGQLNLVWLDPKSTVRTGWELLCLALGRPRRHWPRMRGERFRVQGLEGALPLTTDGARAGMLPAEISVVPAAIPMIVPQVAVPHRKPKFKSLQSKSKGKLIAEPNIAAVTQRRWTA